MNVCCSGVHSGAEGAKKCNGRSIFGMLACLGSSENLAYHRSSAFCPEKKHLLDDFLRAIQELNALLSQQTQAVMDGDPDFSRFDILLHLAHERKDLAKYTWINHVETHKCQEG
jgi:hypothetical protein